MFVACFVSSLKLSHSVQIKVASGAAQISVPNISADTPLMGCSVSEGQQEADARRGAWAAAFISSSALSLRRVSAAQLAVAVAISSAGWVLQDVLQVVRPWVWW